MKLDELIEEAERYGKTWDNQRLRDTAAALRLCRDAIAAVVIECELQNARESLDIDFVKFIEDFRSRHGLPDKCNLTKWVEENKNTALAALRDAWLIERGG